MKKQLSLFILLVLFFAGGSIAQASKLDLNVRRLLQEKPKQSLSKILKSGEKDEYVNVFVRFSGELDEDLLMLLDATVQTKVDGIATVYLPKDNVAEIAQISNVEFISIGGKVHKTLDISNTAINADSVHQGLGELRQAYSGDGVIVGVCDFGLDFTHPMFFDENGNTKIKRVWNQKDEMGTKPSGFAYGSEYQTADQLQAKQTSNREDTHGTHVTGIAAGSGGKLGKYKGIASSADIVFVEIKEDEYATRNIIDGINYIFKYAESVGKPAVVNLSLGTHHGPHDGTSDFDRMLDELVGEGKVVVGSAGNEGDKNVHAQYTFTGNKQTIKTIPTVDASENYTVAEVWGDVDYDFDWTVEVWNKSTKTKVTSVSVPFKSTSSRGFIDQTYNVESKATITLKGYSYPKTMQINNRGWLQIYIENSNKNSYAVALVIRSRSAVENTVHMWNGVNLDFETLNSKDNWIGGNSNYSIGEIGGTSKQIITVGSYNIREASAGNVSYFSSKGPTLDGRRKPDILAPGWTVISSLNSFCPDLLPSECIDKEPITGHCYRYMGGTSMSSPMVTGTVALMLEENPLLTPNTIKGLLCKYATLDQYIQSLSPNIRGYGKLNVNQTIVNIDDRDLPVSVKIDYVKNQSIAVKIVPNPNQGLFKIQVEEEGGDMKVDVYDMVGVRIHSNTVGYNQEINLGNIKPGIYFVKIFADKKSGQTKMLIIN
ncbi:MAG: S8 family peptidase [Prevotellaceae bacterium]|jgi:subtilisin family serine protease|nr:S8 family peptidase [Prevotellaceae bacterium]